ncbi:GntR family transcriptional regulator [Kaistia dalseonensis]|uniref:DNA-binding GntR family transcriptional regulator n=1 Tax=Kaistia dalseonensis TaxID=410840 RepID=A0ABU0H0N5_9HYPH|nr:GntR family transcriptional regulator [Kaistia dalseonensis]MCX5493304.1 GntR family transcriptional regulator [Kaistia dalseonensis]MDQ0435861.1 DNA-binding GntR family transcriptional regulator [Kaistia dalseonensis]
MKRETDGKTGAGKPGPEKVGPRRGAGVATVYEALKRDILDMTIAPGDQLDETGLALRFGLSRTPIREALVKLVSEGLATTLPNRNTIVSAIDYAELPAYLDALMLMYRVTTRLAAERRSDADLLEIHARQLEFARAVDEADAIAMIERNRQFHLAIAEAGGNRYYIELFARLLNEGTRLLRLYYAIFEDHLPPQYVKEHEQIIEAIEAHDMRRADELGRQHAEQIIGQLKRFMSPTVGNELQLDD